MTISALKYIRNIQTGIEKKNQVLNQCIENLATLVKKVKKIAPGIKDPIGSTKDRLFRTNEDMEQSFNEIKTHVLNGMNLSSTTKKELKALEKSSFLFSDLMLEECQTQLTKFTSLNKAIEEYGRSHTIVKTQLQNDLKPVQE